MLSISSLRVLKLKRFNSQAHVINELQLNLIKKSCLCKYQQQNTGYTLIEILAIVLIVGVLAAIAAPGWLSFVSRQRLNKANNAVLASLQEAQREAKKTKISYSFSFKNLNGIPKIIIYPAGSIPPDNDNRWETLGEDMGFQPNQVVLYSNMDANTGNTKASATINYSQLGSGTVTFDYLGSLLNPNVGTAGGSSDQLGFKIAVAAPKSGSTTQATNTRRCVIIDTLLGGMRTATDSNCN